MKIVYRTRWRAIRSVRGVLYRTRSRKPARVNAKIPPSDRPSVRPPAPSVRLSEGGGGGDWIASDPQADRDRRCEWQSSFVFIWPQ